jgi:hypothetical protein
MWAHAVSAAFGVALMFAPAVLSYRGAAADLAHVVGPLVATAGVVAISAVTRPVRWCNVPLGVALVVLPWVLGAPLRAALSDVGVGLAVATLALVRGSGTDAFGGGWRSILRRFPGGAA